jgi:hypothetical protein
MKKQKKSLSEQLGSIKGTFAASTNGSKVLSEKATFKNNKSDTINQPLKNQSAYPCKDITSDFLLLSFTKKNEAILYSDTLWDTASITSKQFQCSKCEKFHLADENNLPLVSKVSFFEASASQKIGDQTEVRNRCHQCKSADGKPKAIFTDLYDAQYSIDRLSVDVIYTMHAYQCPHKNGLHLTKLAPRYAKQYIGAVKQSRGSKNAFQKSSLVEIASHSSTEFSTASRKPSLEKRDMTLVCLSCQYKLNLHTDRKCAFCGAMGPYEFR